MVSFEIDGGEAAVRAFVENLQLFLTGGIAGRRGKPRVPSGIHDACAGFGGAQSGGGHQADTDRLSVGLERVEDLVADLLQALEASRARSGTGTRGRLRQRHAEYLGITDSVTDSSRSADNRGGHRLGCEATSPSAAISAVLAPAAMARPMAFSTATASAQGPGCSVTTVRRSQSRRRDSRYPCLQCRAPSHVSAHKGPAGVAQRRRRQHAQRAGQHGSFIRQDVAKHVFGHNDVEVGGPAEQVHRSRIDEQRLKLDVREFIRHHAIGTSRHSREVSSTLALSTEHSLPRRSAASLAATRTMRSILLRV